MKKKNIPGNFYDITKKIYIYKDVLTGMSYGGLTHLCLIEHAEENMKSRAKVILHSLFFFLLLILFYLSTSDGSKTY